MSMAAWQSSNEENRKRQHLSKSGKRKIWRGAQASSWHQYEAAKQRKQADGVSSIGVSGIISMAKHQ